MWKPLPKYGGFDLDEAFELLKDIKSPCKPVVLHHFGSPDIEDYYKGVGPKQVYHYYTHVMKPPYHGFTYNFVVTPDGGIWFGVPLDKRGRHCWQSKTRRYDDFEDPAAYKFYYDFDPAHETYKLSRSANWASVGIGMQLNGDVEQPTLKQYESTMALIEWCEPKIVLPHRAFAVKSCPGSRIEMENFIPRARLYVGSESRMIDIRTYVPPEGRTTRKDDLYITPITPVRKWIKLSDLPVGFHTIPTSKGKVRKIFYSPKPGLKGPDVWISFHAVNLFNLHWVLVEKTENARVWRLR